MVDHECQGQEPVILNVGPEELNLERTAFKFIFITEDGAIDYCYIV